MDPEQKIPITSIDKEIYGMDQVFGPEGLLARNLPGFEHRPQQVQMARAVCRSLKTGTPLLCEAATGIGKSLAYLIPLALWAVNGQKKGLVATYTKTLQHQLIERDIPFLQKHLGLRLRAALCLGMENYLCLRKLKNVEERRGPEYEMFGPVESWRPRLLKWATSTKTGIHADVPFSIPGGAWHAVARTPETCLRDKCAYGKNCFYNKAKRKQETAHVLVANHHVFFADITTGRNLLPPYEAVVFDEAHNLEDTAASYFGLNVSRSQCEAFVNSVYSQKGSRGFLNRRQEIPPDRWNHLVSLAGFVSDNTEEFFNTVERHHRRGSPRTRLRRPLENLPDCRHHLRRLLEDLKRTFPNEDPEGSELGVILKRGDEMSAELKALIEQSVPESVYWIEQTSSPESRRRQPDISLNSVPLNVGEILRKKVYSDGSTYVFVSATLSDGVGFSFTKERLGVREADEVILPTPFDYGNKVGIYVDPKAPLPTEQDKFEDYLVETVPRIVSFIPGGSFVLFTSLALMDKVHERILERADTIANLPPLLIQGEYPKEETLRRFRDAGRAVLFGSATFWQGVDVPGEALSCVILTRLPFAVPDDPICEARSERIEAEGRSAFFDFQVPNAVMMFRQGFGRLIRSHEDRGIVAVLDSRIVSKAYGRRFISSIPECRLIEEIDEIPRFFGR